MKTNSEQECRDLPQPFYVHSDGFGDHSFAEKTLWFIALAFGLAFTAQPLSTSAAVIAVDKARAEEAIAKLTEVNRYWLVAPPPSVTNLSYTLRRAGGSQEFVIIDPSKAPRSRLQGVTYSAELQRLARSPGEATVVGLEEQPGRLRLQLNFEPEVRGAVGNGVENSWNGYHSLGGADAYVVIDTSRWVPLEAGVGRLRETFSDFVPIDAGHFAPLAIRIEVQETKYDWRFRLYEPGLWLLDEGVSGLRRLAWTEQVQVNQLTPKVLAATAASKEREEAERKGQARLRQFLAANKNWLLPSIEARRGLVYEYRQETPYLERVLFDTEANLVVRQESTKESPDKPTRQKLWLKDGRSWSGSADPAFLELQATDAAPPWTTNSWASRDRLVQHVAMGLALECALTALAREPGSFWVEVRETDTQPNRYTMVLRPKQTARLFTGTMLVFTSWCYMHDVSYDRSEIVCDAATHHPLEEHNYADKELKGSYWYEDWLHDNPGSAPGRIRAILPHFEQNRDQALEMDARFRFVMPEVWLLDRVESRFRNTESLSVGTLNLAPATPQVFEPIRSALRLSEATSDTLDRILNATGDPQSAALSRENWSSFYAKAAWAEKALRSAKDHASEKLKTREPLIGLHRARLSTDRAIEFDGVSTVPWCEFLSKWVVTITDDHDRVLSTLSTNLQVRAEGGPTPFSFKLALPENLAGSEAPLRFSVNGNVDRQTGAYHGHGMWMRFADPG